MVGLETASRLQQFRERSYAPPAPGRERNVRTRSAGGDKLRFTLVPLIRFRIRLENLSLASHLGGVRVFMIFSVKSDFL